MYICSPTATLFTYNPYSKQLILLLVKKQDARFVDSRANNRSVLEDMTRASAYQLLVYLQDLLILKIIRARLYPMTLFLKKIFPEIYELLSLAADLCGI